MAKLGSIICEAEHFNCATAGMYAELLLKSAAPSAYVFLF